jgi:tetratricopeptide (TPR) repeat protein
LPIEVAGWLAATPLPGRMLNHLNFGGHLMWAQPAPVFIDGRLEVIGERFFEEYRRVLGSDEALEAAVARWGIGYVVFPYRTNPELLVRLSRSARWRLVYVDGQAVVFARPAPGLERRVDESARRALSAPAEPLQLRAVPGLDGPTRPAALARATQSLIERQHFPDEAFGWGLFHHFRGEYAPAATRFAEAVRASNGRYYEIYHNLGAALARLGHRAEAAACYRIVLDAAPGNTQARRRLADLE